MTRQLTGPRNWLARAAVAVGAVATLAVSLALSVVLFAVLLVVGAVGFGVLWWKTRGLRAAMRDAETELRQRFEQQQGRPQQGPGGEARSRERPRRPGSGDVLEGEFVVVEETHRQDHTRPPRQ